jgi:hypothetical protein
MNVKKGGGRGPRRAGVLAVMGAVAVLTTGCVVHVHFGSSAARTGQPPYRAELAYAQCVRTHGLPGFPDPSPSGSFSWQLTGNPGSPAARANDICKHLLLSGGPGPDGAVTPATSSPPGAVALLARYASR